MSTTASQPPSSAPRQGGPSSPPPQPPLASPPTAATSLAAAEASTAGGPAVPASPLQPTLPSAETQRHVAEARAAVVASMGNMLDRELQTRASMLHENAGALARQERDVVRATEGLRREREKLAREADAAARRVKELGNVQNWAEVLERGFLVLEETVRLANGGSEDGGGSCSCSCSDCGGSESGGEGDERMDVDGDGKADGAMDGVTDGKTYAGMDGKVDAGDVNGSLDMDMNGSDRMGLDEPEDKGKQREAELDTVLDSDGGPGTWSDASRSLMEPESSTGTSRAKGSETASTAS